jgi:outer membrane protein TolC
MANPSGNSCRIPEQCSTWLRTALQAGNQNHPCWFFSLVLLLLFPGWATAQGEQQTSPPAVTINLREAVDRARANSQQLQSANLDAALAHEDRLQAKAGLLPSLSFNNQVLYTQGNGTPSGIFVANNGVHVYTSQGNIHEEILSVSRVAEYRRTIIAQAIAEAKSQILARGLTATVVQDFYALVVAQRRQTNAEQSLQEAQSFANITQKLESGGEVARSDTIKARIVVEQRNRDLQDARLAIDRTRINLAVLIFPDFRTDFSAVDDLKTLEPLVPLDEILTQATEKSPDLRAAQMSLRQEELGIRAARSGYLPTLSFDYWYGIEANQFAIHSGDLNNLGSSAQASLNIPVWNWGATRSKIRQAEFRRRQAELDLALTRKQLLSELNSLYAEAKASLTQLDSLRQSLDLAAESLRLTVLRYQAGEVSVLEVVDAQSTMTQSRNALDDGQARYRVAIGNLQTLTGSL